MAHIIIHQPWLINFSPSLSWSLMAKILWMMLILPTGVLNSTVWGMDLSIHGDPERTGEPTLSISRYYINIIRRYYVQYIKKMSISISNTNHIITILSIKTCIYVYLTHVSVTIFPYQLRYTAVHILTALLSATVATTIVVTNGQ